MTGSHVDAHRANEDRLPCPFCGADAGMLVFGGEELTVGGDRFFIQCTNCNARGPSNPELINAPLHWNFRGGFPQ